MPTIFTRRTHAVFSGQTISRLIDSPIKEVIVTDTIALPPEKLKPLGKKLKVLSVAPILANAIKS